MSKIFTRVYATPQMIDETRCVGCGQCVYQCKFDVRKMVEDQRDVFVKTKKKSEAITF